MTQSHLIEQAKGGDPQAIATLMNRSLQPKGILARVSREGQRLMIQLEAEQVPNRDALMTFVQNGLTNLHINNISTVEVTGQQSGLGETAWVQEWQLDPAEAETGLEFISRDTPEAVVLRNPPPPAVPPRPIPPPAPPPRPPRPPEPLIVATPGDTTLDDDLNLDINLDELDLDALELDEADLFPMRDGLSNLAYAPLEVEPLPLEPLNGLGPTNFEADDVPPELLAAEAARQVQQEIPANLLFDEDPELPAVVEGSSESFEANVGTAQFPDLYEVALDGELYPSEDSSLLEFEDEAFDEPHLEGLMAADEAIAPDINLPPPPPPDISDRADFADVTAFPPPPPPPPDITASPDMDAGDELRITQIDEDESEQITELEPKEFSTVQEGLLLDDEDNPHGQMVGSPIAIQPIHPSEGDLETQEERSGTGMWVTVVLLFVVGWIGTLIVLPLLAELRDPDPVPPTSPSPQAERPRSA